MLNRPFFLFVVSLILGYTGCYSGEHSSEPAKPKVLENKQPATAEVSVGGKVWRINPDLSYRATGIWTNPNPRALTEAEKKRLDALPELIDTLNTKLKALHKERAYLERIERKQIIVRYNIGKPPNPHSKIGSTILELDKVIDLGEFHIEIEDDTSITTSEEKRE